MYKYYTADCTNGVNGIIIGNCITRVYFWQSARFAYNELTREAKENRVRLLNFRRVK